MADGIRYIATINTPGYLPQDDEPPVFDSPGEAWAYLLEERERGEDHEAEETDADAANPWREGPEYSETWSELSRRTKYASAVPHWSESIGTVHGPTPGSNSPHDLGLSYTVDIYQTDDPDHSDAPDGKCIDCEGIAPCS